ncbi:hypothetical protein PsYK624_092010 [Phanerochaete sordida]|uniref:Extracellular membrane protein CFEM domain-containing protein n=1 Tax=Phanerochaete sordida TaxID=48140 RepID=A0A9P3LGF7_9APHY|nr:hypothetical protein PsYK624_092010 [Phanerochaete sordida]
MRTTLVLIAFAAAALAAPQFGPGPVETVCCVQCFELDASSPPSDCCCKAIVKAQCSTKCAVDTLLREREANGL